MKKTLSLSILVVVVVSLIFYLLIKGNDRVGYLEFVLPGNATAKIKIENNKVDIINLFNELFADEKNSEIITSLLEKKGFYTIDSLSLVDTIRNLEYDHPTAEKIRNLLHFETKGPFQELSKEVRVKIVHSDENFISQGQAAICRSDNFSRNFVLMYDTKELRLIGLKATQNAPCPSSMDKSIPPIFLITREDANELYNNTLTNKDEGEPIIASITHSTMRMPNFRQCKH